MEVKRIVYYLSVYYKLKVFEAENTALRYCCDQTGQPVPLPLRPLVLHFAAGTERLHSVLLWRPYGAGSPLSNTDG